MGLSFLSPIYFLGLIAVLIPILIHLMERRKDLTISLPTVKFIIEAQRRVSRRLKIRRWLLLLSRIMMIAVLTMILARPVIISRESLVNAARQTSAVLILDNSPSMEYRQGSMTRWEAALQLADDLSSAIVPNGEVAVSVTSGTSPGPSFSRDRNRISSDLGVVTMSSSPSDLVAALNEAYRLMERASFPHRQIVLVTDMARPDWNSFNPGSLDSPDLSIPVRVIDITGGQESRNISVREMEVFSRPGDEGVGRARVTLEVQGGPDSKKTTLLLDIDGRIAARRLVDFEGAGERVFEFPLPRMEGGTHRLMASIDQDLLPFDNRRFAVFEYGGQIRVMTVDGSPQASLVGSETYFLRAALVPDRFSGEQKVDNSIIFPGQLTPGSLSVFNVIILANVRSLERSLTGALSKWVSEGGGLIIFTGENYQSEEYRSSFDSGGADLLPVYPGEAAEPPGRGILSYVNYDAYPLEIFKKPGSGEFSRVRFKKYVSLGPGGLKPGARSLIAFDEIGEKPFLVERTLGKGKVLMFTSTADLDWTNFPTQTVYLPLLQRSLEYLAGTRGVTQASDYEAGGTVNVDLKADFSGNKIEVESPSGQKVQAFVDHSGSGARAVLNRAEEAGFYFFYPDGSEVPVPVNIAQEESDLRRAAPETLQSISEVLPIDLVPVGEKALGVENLRGTTDPTSWLFTFLLVLLFMEGLMSIKRRDRAGRS